MKQLKYLFVLTFLLTLIPQSGLRAQISLGGDSAVIDYANPKEYEIGGITVQGVQYLDPSVLIMLTGLKVGDRIKVPGEEITAAIEKLWKQGLFDDVKIVAEKVEGRVIFLQILLQERPRLSKFTFKGIRKGEADDLRDKLKLAAGEVVTRNTLVRAQETIKKYFVDKGFLKVEVDIQEVRDTTKLNNVVLIFNIDKKDKVKINTIIIHGNEKVKITTLKNALKETKEKGSFRPLAGLDRLTYNLLKSAVKLDAAGITDNLTDYYYSNLRMRVFKSSKFIREDFEADMQNIIKKYNELGYRDAEIIRDSVYFVDDKSINVELWIKEGRKYYFRNITWVGNTKYSADVLNSYLKIRKGDVYNQEILQTNLSYNPNGFDVSSLYLDDGYLFFNVQPVEVKIENDSIDLEIRVYEGKQATLSRVTVKGNDRTSDHVILRELYTKPGQLFSRNDIIRTQRELAQLKYFNPEKLGIDYTPNPQDGTVDLEYSVEETSSDQIELSGGWGYGRIVGTLGLSFNNFSTRRLFKKDAWKPIPSGDGQKLNLRFQTYGVGYTAYSMSFTEPWLGGKKPNAFTVSYYHSKYTNGLSSSDTNYASFVINGVGLGLGKRLEWPDDYFQIYHGLNYQKYKLKNYARIFTFGSGNGEYNKISYTFSFGRSSDDNPIFPRRGSTVNLSVELTPPYSLFSNKDYSKLSAEEKYKWIEYHKWKFTGNWYTNLVGNLVLASKYRMGFLGYYNKSLGVTPFERFYVGGDGLSGYGSLDGREIIALRGYANESITPEYYENAGVGGTIYSRYMFELRFPLSLNPSSTIYALAFMEGGNTWNKFTKFNPFKVYRSAGLGLRIFLPMFGVLGLDYGYGYDEVPGQPSANGGQFHFSINQSID